MYGDMYEYEPKEYPPEPTGDRCNHCGKPIYCGERVIEALDEMWHVDCLKKECQEDDSVRDLLIDEYIEEMSYECK